MTIKAVCVAVALTMLGCGGSGDGETCKERHGFYKSSYRLESGDCSQVPDYVFDWDAPGDGSCTDRYSGAAADTCEDRTDEVCTTDIGRNIFRGNAVWNSSGTHATGTISVEIRGHADTVLCRGIYGVTITKL